MNPIVPVKLTTAATITETVRDDRMRTLNGSTPTVWESWSPEVSMSIREDARSSRTVHTIVGIAMAGRLSQYPAPMFPRFHEYTALIWVGSAISIRSDEPAEKKYITPIPQRSIIVSVILFSAESKRMMVIGISERRNALQTVAAFPLNPGIIENPNTMADMAPRDAPEETPMV